MRLHFTLSANSQPVSFDYQHRLTGVFHKWLRRNDLHDKISLYSLSWLDGSHRAGNHLEFPRGAGWFVSFYEDEFAERLVNGVFADPEMFCGMRVLEIEQKRTPDFGTKYKFRVASPVLIKGARPADGSPPHHYLFHEPESDDLLTATLRHKMDEAGLEEEHKTVKVSFDRTFPSPKIKKVNIEKFKEGRRIFIEHKASICPVIVEGTKEAVQFVWCVGVGAGTGSGFGSLRE